MANKKLTDLTELTTPDDGDFLYIVDVSDTTESAQGTSKKIRKDKVDSGASKENIANKQNSLAIDGTGTKYPTVDAVNTIDLQQVLTNGTYAEFDGDSRNSAYFLDGNPFDRSVEFYLDNGISGSGNAGSVQINKNTAVEFQNYSGTKRGDIAIYGGNVEILQANIGTPGTTTVSFTNPTVNTSIKIPAKIAVGTYTLATTDETVNLTGDQTITGSKTFDNTQVILYGGASNPLYIQANIAGAYIENLSTNDGLKIENTSSGDALNINTTPFSTGKALVIKNNDVEKFSVSKNGYFNSQGGFINGILDFTNTDDVGLGQFYMNLNRFLFTNTSGNLQFLTQNSGFVTYKSPTISGTFSNANLTTNRTFTLPDATGTIPIVSQTITNGVTDKSPSEDAVFDALDLKVNLSGNQTITGVTTLTGVAGSATSLDVKNGNANGSMLIGADVNAITRTNGVRKLARFTTPSFSDVTKNHQIFAADFDDTTSSRIYFGGTNGSTQLGCTEINFVTVTANGNTGGNTAMQVKSSGAVTINTTTDDGIATNKLQVNGNVKATQFRISALNTAPASATATGTLGEIRITATHIYVCTATNTWVRTALITW